MAVLSAQKIMFLMNETSSKVLCYVVFVGHRKFLVKLGHADEFIALYSGDTITFESSTLRWHKFSNLLNWYERVV